MTQYKFALGSGGQQIDFDAVSLTTSGGIYHYVEDLLGTSRVMTTSAGTVCYDGDFDPYGGEHTYTDTCPQNYKFEGRVAGFVLANPAPNKERDTETGNDDFGARYYTSRFGRWLSADWSSVPVPVPYANLTNPQTLNLYAMVSDDPESFADLDGHVQNASEGVQNTGRTCASTGQGGTGSAYSGTCGANQTAQQTQDQQQAEAAKQQGKSGLQKWMEHEQVTPEKTANALKRAGQMGDAGVKAGLVVVGVEAAIAGVVVAAPAVATATTSTYVQATTALSAAGTAIGNAASSLGNTLANAYTSVAQTVFRAGVQLDTIKPGGGALRAAGDFLTGLTPGARTPPNSQAGQLGKAIGAAYKVYKYLTQ